MVEVEESGSAMHFVVVAKVLETAVCLPLIWEHSQLFVVTVGPKRLQVSEAVFEPLAIHSLVAAVELLLERIESTLVVQYAGVELDAPKVAHFAPDFALGSMMVANEPVEVLVPMDLN